MPCSPPFSATIWGPNMWFRGQRVLGGGGGDAVGTLRVGGRCRGWGRGCWGGCDVTPPKPPPPPSGTVAVGQLRDGGGGEPPPQHPLLPLPAALPAAEAGARQRRLLRKTHPLRLHGAAHAPPRHQVQPPPQKHPPATPEPTHPPSSPPSPSRGNSKYHYYGLRIKATSPLLRLMEDQQHLAMRQQPFAQKQR